MPPINETKKLPTAPASKAAKSPQAPISDEDADGISLRRSLHGIKLSDALQNEVATPHAISPGLLYEGESTFVRVTNGIDAQMYAAIIGMAVAGGRQLSPYGKCIAGHVLFVYSAAVHTRVMEQFKLLCESFEKVETRELAESNLHLYCTDLGSDDTGSLVEPQGRNSFDLATPPGCKLVVFFDIARCLRKRACSEEDFRQLETMLSDLNRNGIATLVFYRAGKKTDAVFADALLTDCNGYTLELTEDRAAPREYGTGFTVKHRKASEHDTLPTYFQVWYTVINNALDFGWECRTSDDASNHKQIEIAERQKRVAALLTSGMQQKDIAAALGVNSATVSRDASMLKTKAKNSRKNALTPTPPKR